jgi:polar amino acid transport system substrate-binding protein
MNLSPLKALTMILATLTALPALADGLAPTGTLRATFLAANPVQARVDAKSGEVAGPAADLVRELARRLGVPYTITPVNGVRAVIDSVRTHTADIGFLAFDATRAAEVDFSQPYSLAHNTYLAPANSAIGTCGDADRAGIRIGGATGEAGDLFLTLNLKHAELKRNPGGVMEEALRMLSASEIDAYAANRQRLVEAAAHADNMLVLPDNFFAVEQAIVVSKGDTSSLNLLNRFIDDVRASGFIQAAIDSAKLAGVDVAPPPKGSR